jgi:hypothetical protein
MANDQHTILRVEENGIEYFTDKKTGECAVSIRGLARMCGVRINAIQNIIESADQQNPVKGLEGLAGKEVWLTNKIGKKNNATIKPIRSAIAIKIIRYYDRKGKPKAQATMDALAEIGIENYIQVKTGYTPSQYAAAPTSHEILNRILDAPRPWVRLYSPEFCKVVYKWYNYHFYWLYVYDILTAEEKCKHDRLNPVINGKRDVRIHQYLDQETKDRLEPYINRLTTLVETSTSRQDFETRYNRLNGLNQLGLPFAV